MISIYVASVDSIRDRVEALLENNEANFIAWTLFITEVEDALPLTAFSFDDIQKICLVYDAFLSEYPLCYGYWTRYAGHKARFCTMHEVEEVYKRAVKAASHSVHLWVSYCSFGVSVFQDPADIRRLFERGLSYVAKDYYCYLLWDKYIEFEFSQKQWSLLAHIYINTLSFPSRRLLNYYESFKKLVALLAEHMGFQNVMSAPLEAIPDYGMAFMKGRGYAEISNVVDLLSQNLAGPEVFKKFISIGELLYRQSSQLDKHISCFEAHIRRHHFHIKPLDDFQLENWHKYLTFVEDQGNFDWTVKLYERCLIPCANYSEFWIRYVEFVDVKGGREIANEALERAVKVFLKRSPAFRQYYSMFKEKIGDTLSARGPFLGSCEDCVIEVVENISRKANMEKRMGNIEAAQEIYNEAIQMAHEKQSLKLLSLLYISFARFTFVLTGSVDTTKEVFINGIQQNPSKSIIEGFLDFITMHGGIQHVKDVDLKMDSILSPKSEASQVLSSQDCEEISWLYLKFVDLHGTIHDIRKAWERHRKLFPYFMQLSTLCDHSSSKFRVENKNIVVRNAVLNSSPNHCSEIPSKFISPIHIAENLDKINIPISLPVEVVKSVQKPFAQADNLMEESIAAEALQKSTIPEGSEIGIMNNFCIEPPIVVQIPDSLSENIETDIPTQDCRKEGSNGKLEPPALGKLSIANTPTSHDNSTQVVTSKKDGNKPEENGEVSSLHTSPNLSFNCDSDSQPKPEEDRILLHPASHADKTATKADLEEDFQENINRNQALPAKVEHSQTPGEGQCAQVYYDVQPIADPKFMHPGYVQTSIAQQWQNYAHMQNQSGGNNLQVSLPQSYVSQTSLNSQDPQANHIQLQYHLTGSQAYTNSSLAFLGQHMHHPTIVYAQAQQFQQASSQNQIQGYQAVLQSDSQYGYHQTVQEFPPHIMQYYQNLYYFQQQQMQQMQQRQYDQHVRFNYHKQQWSDTSQARTSQPEVHENQDENNRMQLQPDAQQCHNLDEKLNLTKQQQIQQEKPEELTQPSQQSTQVLNYEQSQLLYVQQQQQFYIQQQQQHQMYLQQQRLFQQQQQQQQQHHQQLLAFQQQHPQCQPQIPIPLPQQEQSRSPQQPHLLPAKEQNQDCRERMHSQGKEDPVQSSAQLEHSCSANTQ